MVERSADRRTFEHIAAFCSSSERLFSVTAENHVRRELEGGTEKKEAVFRPPRGFQAVAELLRIGLLHHELIRRILLEGTGSLCAAAYRGIREVPSEVDSVFALR
jgi:hypothetical protein